MSCIIGGYHANYHTNKHNYNHAMGTKEGGNIIILGGCGPMGLGAISYGINFENKPKRIVVTDINDARIARAKEVVSPEYAAQHGVELIYVNTSNMDTAYDDLMKITDGHGYDDVFVYTPIRAVAELGNKLLAFDGCMNFFSGPTDKNFSADINLYDCHYTSTHISGIDSIAETTLNLPKIPGGKKLAYTQFDMPMTAIEDFAKLGEKDPFFLELDKCCKAHKGLWNAEAEKMILKHFNVEI